jgi:membrane protease YdiL (CAAX protease family)
LPLNHEPGRFEKYGDEQASEKTTPWERPPVFPRNHFPGESTVGSMVRLLIFLAMVYELGPAIIVEVALAIFGPFRVSDSPAILLFMEAGNFVFLLGVTAAMALLERRQIGGYGLPAQGILGKNFWLGALLGIAEISALVGLIAAFGGYSFGNLVLSAGEVLRWGAVHLVLFLVVGLYEEFLFRGYAQFTLSQGIGFWPAAVLLSAGFGYVHLNNRNEDWIGALSVAIVGLLFAFTLRRTGNLWYAVGLHASFDWGETFLYSVPNSGVLMQGHLSNAVLHGPKWLTGASVGPEGSVFCFVTMGLQFLVVMLLFPKRATEPPAELPIAAN